MLNSVIQNFAFHGVKAASQGFAGSEGTEIVETAFIWAVFIF